MILSHIIWLSVLTDEEEDFSLGFLDIDEPDALARTIDALGVPDGNLTDVVGYDLDSEYPNHVFTLLFCTNVNYSLV